MSGTKGVKQLPVKINDLNNDLFQRYHRRVIYMEMIEPRFSSMQSALIHLYILIDGKMREYEIPYADSAEFYYGFIGFMDRFSYADIFRNYRFNTSGFNYRILIHKGATLDANNDLGGFVFQNNKTSFLISPYRREIFERLSKDLLNYSDGVAQLVRVGRLLKNEKFRHIHNEYFGKIGLSSLNDGAIVKLRYADSIANNNVITDQELFKEYLELINGISMSEFTAQSVVSQLADRTDTKQILMENYSNFLFADEDEIEFASMLLGLFLCRTGFNFTTQEWIAGVNYIKYLNHNTFLRMTESELDYKRNLNIYRVNYVLDNVPLTKIVHFIYDFFEYKHLSQNICAFYPRLNALLGEDIREKYLQLETINVSLKSFQESKRPVDFFKEPKLVNFSTAADKEIQKQIIAGKYDRDFVAFYLCNYMQVADYKKYSDILPAVISIIKNIEINDADDYHLFWIASDVLNEFWKLTSIEDKDLQIEIERLIYDIYWSRIGDVWPIMHRKELSFNNEAQARVFEESTSWLTNIRNLSLVDRKLCKYLREPIARDEVDIKDAIDKKRYALSFAKQNDHSLSNYIGNHSDDNNWCYAAIYNDVISSIEILESLLNAQYSLFESKDSKKYVMEQLLLKVRNKDDAKKFYEYILNHIADFENFFKRVKNEDEDSGQIVFNALLALGESAISEAEEGYLRKLVEKVQTKMADSVLAIAGASVRRAKLQNKNITIDFIKSLH